MRHDPFRDHAKLNVIRRRARSMGPLSIAGISEAWRDPEIGEGLRTYARIATEPNEMVGSVHDRMPALVAREWFAA
jgi:putative SOS response-associated peptidase YedK